MTKSPQDRFWNVAIEAAPVSGRFLAFRHRHRGAALAVVLVIGVLLYAFFDAVALAWLIPMTTIVALATPISTRGNSMLPSLAPRTYGVVLLAPPFRFARGDLVLVVGDGLRPLVKRLIAVEGDRIRFEGGRVYVNDEVMTLPADFTQPTPEDQLLAEVPPGAVYVLGEHVASVDSRHLGPFPKSAIAGSYVPLWNPRRSRGRSSPQPRLETLPEPDRADVAALRARGSKLIERLDDMLSVEGTQPGHVWLALRWAWAEVGDRARLIALLRRAHEQSREPRDRAFFAVHLAAVLLEDREYEEALGLIDGDRPNAYELEAVTMDQLKSSMLARLGRYRESLALSSALGPRALAGVKVSALIGLGRIEEARQVAETIPGAGDPRWLRPFVDAYLAEADGDLEEAARCVEAARERGFNDPHLLEVTPHLAALRASPYWDPSWLAP